MFLMMLARKWVSDTEVDAIKHLLDRPLSVGGLTVSEMNALSRLSAKGFVSFSHMRGGEYRLTVRAMTALTERAIRRGTLKVEEVRL